MKNVMKCSIGMSALILAACGGGTKGANPLTEEQQNIAKSALTAMPDVSKDKGTAVDSLALNIKADSPSMSFYENESKSYAFTSILNFPGVNYTVEMKSGPEGMTLTKAQKVKPADADKWLITYNPPNGTVASGESIADKAIVLKMKILNAPVKVSEILTKLDSDFNFNIQVLRNRQKPSGGGIEGLDANLVEGQSYPFSFTMTDPSGTVEKPPQLEPIFKDSLCKDNQCYVDGKQFIFSDAAKPAVESLGKGVWKFNLKFDTVNLQLPILTKSGNTKNGKGQEGVPVEINLRARTDQGKTIPQITKRVFVAYKAEAQTPQFTGSTYMKATSGFKPVMSISTFSLLKRGSVEFDQAAIKAELAKLPGSHDLNCKKNPSDATIATCNWTWNVPCEASLKEYTVKFKSIQNVNGGIKEATQDVKVDVAKGAKCLTGDGSAKAAAAATDGKETASAQGDKK